MNLLASELLKLRTTRVPYVLYGLTMLASGLVAAALVGSGQVDADDADRALSLAQGAGFWSMLAVVLGILIVTNEYRHGTITTTFLAEPDRLRVFAAKLATSLLAGATLAVAAFAAVLLVSLPWLALRDEALPVDGQLVEAVGRLMLAFALSAALGAAVGAIIQSQVATIITVFLWFLIIESIIGVVATLLSGGFDERDPVTPYLPGTVLGGIVGGEQGAEYLLGGGTAIALALLYVAALTVGGAASMTRRDP